MRFEMIEDMAVNLPKAPERGKIKGFKIWLQLRKELR